MHKLTLRKPDGRNLTLYSRKPIPEGISSTVSGPSALSINSHLRWHTLRGEWVAYVTHRPIAGGGDTELPQGDYEVAVYDSRFPILARDASMAPELSVETRPSLGACEAIAFARDPKATLGTLQLDQIEFLLQIWADRSQEPRDGTWYVLPFECRGPDPSAPGQEPAAQVYAYPFVPPIPARELEQQLGYYREHGRGLLEDQIQLELKDGRRIIYNGESVVAFVPICARYPYEVWVAPRRRTPSLSRLEPRERADFARALKTVLLKYDGLWNKAYPYLLVIHQAPADGKEHPEAHVRAEFYAIPGSTARAMERPRQLAGTELGAGVFANDGIPEEKAAELRAIKVSV